MQVMMVAFGLYFGVGGDLSESLQRFLWIVSLVFATPVILYSAQPFYAGALRGSVDKLNMDIPVSIALLGAYSASVRHYYQHWRSLLSPQCLRSSCWRCFLGCWQKSEPYALQPTV